MTILTTLRRLPRVAAAAILAATLLVPAAAAPAHAAEVTFGVPTATFEFGDSITFSVPMTSTVPLERLELRLRFPDNLGPFVTEVPVGRIGVGQTATYRLDLAGSGHLVPNVEIEATWAAVTESGEEPVLSSSHTVLYEDTDHDWRTLKGDLVAVHWYEGGEGFARRALEIGDKAVRDTATLLGVTETRPIDFFIYGDEASFRKMSGPATRENVGGHAHSDIRTLFALITPDSIDDAWVDVVIPHELVHLVLDTAVQNPYRFLPRWFNEGLAVYLSEGYTPGDRSLVEGAARRRELWPLTALAGQFPTEPAKTYLAYAESVAAIDHLVRIDGEDALLNLVAAYADGPTDDEAFTKALGRDLGEFQDGWLAELGAEPPERLGPVPNPTGAVPPGWDAPAGGGNPDASPGASTPPGAPGGPVSPPDAPSADGSDSVIVLGAVAILVIVVITGLLVARRRTAPP